MSEVEIPQEHRVEDHFAGKSPAVRAVYDSMKRRRRGRIVGAEELEGAAIALAPLVDRDDAVEGTVLGAGALEADFDHRDPRGKRRGT